MRNLNIVYCMSVQILQICYIATRTPDQNVKTNIDKRQTAQDSCKFNRRLPFVEVNHLDYASVYVV